MTVRSDSQKWLELFKQIPRGTAIGATKDEMGLLPHSVKVMLTRFKKQKALENTYYTRIRKVHGKETLFIVHSKRVVRDDDL